ncbi:HlyD family secretion protein [Brevibacillus borstelensis]|uniref:HlyD family secretion protein n=1 Tax=Brevibacillus borstelensis TaxID=45462 RepID=UPI0030BEDC64
MKYPVSSSALRGVQVMQIRKIFTIKRIGSLFLGVLLVLLFFSKTIYTYNMPVATAVSPQNGKLNKLEITTGIVEFSETIELYAEIGGKVEDVFVRDGDHVVKGQKLIGFSFDEDIARQKIKEIQLNKSKLAVDIENIDMKLDKINQSMNQLKTEAFEQGTDYELSELQKQLAKAEEEYAKLKLLYESDAIAKQELDNAAYSLDSFKRKYADLQKSKQKQLDDYLREIAALQRDLKTKNFDLSGLALQEETYRKTLSDYSNNTVILAPENAVISTLPVKKGQNINDHQHIASLGTGNQYEVEADISLDNNFTAVGDIVKLSNSSRKLEGIVSKITPSERAKKVTVSVTSNEINRGETFEVRFQKESAVSYTIVPNGAINKDSDGYFLYQIKRRDGILGKEFYVEKLRVYIGDSDAENTVIVQGVTFFEPVLLLSDKSISEHDVIQIKNEGDFFAD